MKNFEIRLIYFYPHRKEFLQFEIVNIHLRRETVKYNMIDTNEVLIISLFLWTL